MEWTKLDGGRLVVMIELKYLSGKSGEGVFEEAGEIAISEPLGGEYQDLADLLRVNDQGVLIYLTAPSGLPHDDFAAPLELI